MAYIEIERKFLVLNDTFKEQASKFERIAQGYISTDSEATVRVRIKGEKGFITIKGKSNEKGVSRFEWEKEISKDEAAELLTLSKNQIIDKTRYYVPFEKKTFEVDVFEGENKGLIVAELELQSEKEKFAKPAWLGEEVTGNKKYYNSYLSSNPFKEWEQ